MLALLLASLLTADDAGTPPPPAPEASRVRTSDVACQSVNECWLAPDGAPIARPKKFKKRSLPAGTCSSSGLLWLRHRLSCEQQRCTSTFVGDKC